MNKIIDYTTKEQYDDEKFLYRYVPIDIYSLQSLNMGHIFLNKLSNMNDIHEMEPYYSSESQNEMTYKTIQDTNNLVEQFDCSSFLTTIGQKFQNIAKNSDINWLPRYLQACESGKFEGVEDIYDDIVKIFHNNL